MSEEMPRSKPEHSTSSAWIALELLAFDALVALGRQAASRNRASSARFNDRDSG
jgi:hypothetical protein